MAVVNNTLSEIGDSIVISAGVPITGLSAISGYTENVSGETATRQFKREFRYSLDGINWTDNAPLITANLTSIPVNPKFDFMIEYTYTRVGTDTTGLLVFNGVSINGSYVANNCGITFNKSVFKYFFSSCTHNDIQGWSLNVLRKLYKKGVVPNYMVRGDNQNKNEEDRDYIDFWRSISSYFGMIVAYARKFENIAINQELLTKYLRGRGVFLCENTPLTDLNYIMKNYWDEMRHRGTVMVTKKKGEIINGTAKPVNGELLRLICFNSACDEFLFEISESNRIGWVVNEWSPLYQGLQDHPQLTKLYEQERHVVSLSNYPLVNSGSVSIVSEPSAPDTTVAGAANAMRIVTPAAGQKAGIDSVVSNATNVSDNLDYELSFFVKANSGSPKITVRIFGFNQSNTPQTVSAFMNPSMPASNDVVVGMSLPTVGDWYKFTCSIKKASQGFIGDLTFMKPSMGDGYNLRMSSGTCKISPEIVIDNTSSNSTGDVSLYNIRFAPLETEYSTGFIGVNGFVQTWMQNNNGSMTNAEIEEAMKYYLLPYKIILNNNFL